MLLPARRCLSVAIVALLGACGGGNARGGSASTTTAVTTTTVTTTSVRQVASIVALHRGQLIEAIDLIQECFDRYGPTCFQGDAVQGRYSKAINLAAGFRRDLEAALPVDREVERLTAATISDLRGVANTVGPDGTATMAEIEEHLAVVERNLAAWEPYL